MAEITEDRKCMMILVIQAAIYQKYEYLYEAGIDCFHDGLQFQIKRNPVIGGSRWQVQATNTGRKTAVATWL